MHFQRLLLVYIPFAVILYFLILIGGCSENTVTTSQSEHFEPEGMMIIEGQDTVMYVFQVQFMQGKDTLKVPLTSLNRTLASEIPRYKRKCNCSSFG